MSEEWLDVLAGECRREGQSQATVARHLGVSSSMVNQALKGRYGGNVERLRGKVEGAYMGAMVDCPVIGELPRNRCIEYQGRKFAATNPLRVALSIACKTCPNRRAK